MAQTPGFTTIVAGATDSSGDPATSYPNAGVMTLNGNVTYPSTDITTSGFYDVDSSDALGLIADYFIQMQDPSGNEPCPGGSGTGLTIDAALLALQDSFYNPNWASGSICPLNIVGSIAQAFRGRGGQPERLRPGGKRLREELHVGQLVAVRLAAVLPVAYERNLGPC